MYLSIYLSEHTQIWQNIYVQSHVYARMLTVKWKVYSYVKSMTVSACVHRTHVSDEYGLLEGYVW